MQEDKKILVVNNEEMASQYIQEELADESGYSVYLAFNVRSGLEALRESSFDIVIAKYPMPGQEGTEFFRQIKAIDPNSVVIALVETESPRVLKEISQLGIYGSIGKPVNIEKILFLVKKGSELRLAMVANHKLVQSLNEQNISLQRQNTLLAKRIEESTKNLTRLYEDLRSTYMRTIKALAQAIDARDHYTHSHSENVARYAVAIAEEMELPAKDIELIRQACELHDLGKIGVGDNILLKPSSLTPEEWVEIKRHPLTAAQILEPLTFLDGVIDLVKYHHERFDGTGYPEGLKGEAIPLGARIIHLSDAYDSMISARAYRKIPLTKEKAIQEIKENSGTQFDPLIVEAFLRIVDKL